MFSKRNITTQQLNDSALDSTAALCVLFDGIEPLNHIIHLFSCTRSPLTDYPAGGLFSALTGWGV